MATRHGAGQTQAENGQPASLHSASGRVNKPKPPGSAELSGPSWRWLQRDVGGVAQGSRADAVGVVWPLQSARRQTHKQQEGRGAGLERKGTEFRWPEQLLTILTIRVADTR